MTISPPTTLLGVSSPGHSPLDASGGPGLGPSASVPTFDPVLLERNLAAVLASGGAVPGATSGGRAVGRNARIVGLIRTAPAVSGLTFAVARDGLLSGAIEPAPGTRLSLASRYSPGQEADSLVAALDPAKHAAVVINGFGLGHHVERAARRLGRTGVVIVHEPDVALLREVMGRIDMTSWLTSCNLILVHDAHDQAGLARQVEQCESALVMGTLTLEHPASQTRLGDAASRFARTFTRVLESVRTVVATTLVQTETTLRNSSQNIDHYALGGGIADLRGRCAGKPAIIVSAGPSLARNIEQLARPGVRERFVIIAVQTVLRQLLARGIRPHYVTALDYHEISRRFYEGLTADDVRGVTLVAEAKVNPAVTRAFPGVIRCARDEFLDEVLGPGLVRDMGAISAGATVAHLAYFLARHLGCDPVVLVGQDLGFTDGQYYGSGAAIHDTWAPELGEFRTLEMFEHERIMRMRSLLRKGTDVLGRPIYSDEQMNSYLVQFQAMFLSDSERGMRVIDATEGGVLKAGTTPARLSEVIDAELARAERARNSASATLAGNIDLDALIDSIAGADAAASEGSCGGVLDDPAFVPDFDRASRSARVRERLLSLARDVTNIATHSREARALLEQMREHHDDQERVNRLIDRVTSIRAKVESRSEAFRLIERLNQTGAFNRLRADRAINLATDLAPIEAQKRQIDRDIVNVTWLADAGEALATMLREAAGVLDGAPPRTRDPLPAAEPVRESDTSPSASASVSTGPARVAAVAVMLGHEPPELVARTMERLGRVAGIADVVLLDMTGLDMTGDGAALGEPIAPGNQAAIDRVRDLTRHRGVRVLRAASPRPRVGPLSARRVAAARAFARDCWRGGLANLTCYDEVVHPPALLEVFGTLTRDGRGADALLVVGASWAHIDPVLCAELVERHREQPAAHKIVFSQAGPGAAGVVLSRTLTRDFDIARERSMMHSTIGAMLAYVPVAPVMDPIARTLCVGVDPAVRDMRWSITDAERVALIDRALRQAGIDPAAATLADVASVQRTLVPDAPTHLRVELVRDHRRADAALIMGLCQSLGVRAVTLRDARCEHESLPELIRGLRSMNIAVHVRTRLTAAPDAAERLIESAPDILSVETIADDSATYARLNPRDADGGFARLRDNLERAVSAMRRAEQTGVGGPLWVVPRITRRDAVYERLEAWYDGALLSLGHAVIDPRGRDDIPLPDERIAPLALPRLARTRLALGELSLEPDLSVVGEPGVLFAGVDARRQWADLVARRSAAL